MHNESVRRQGPFVPVNCAALPESLLESELFGYVEGAFTGAIKGGKMGLFEQAHKGTIFLDEIAEISPRIQGQLLRGLQEREIRRLGDDKIIPVDVRVIAATNKDLRTLVRTEKFRADLYYRLDILRLNIAPLRERPADIIPLLQLFMQQCADKFNRPYRTLSKESQQIITAYAWLGNVRELRNFAERLIAYGNCASDIVHVSQVKALLGDIENNTDRQSSAVKVSGICALKQAKEIEEIKKY